MTSTTRNTIATVLVAAIVVPYVGYLIRGEMPFLQDPRGMGTVGLVLGLAAVAVTGRAAFAPGSPVHRAALTTGVVALALGIATVWSGTSEALLAVFIAAVVVTWALGEVAATRTTEHTARPLARR
ncbi:hypothetical protein [Geodermatophilus sp. SYSU D00710]